MPSECAAWLQVLLFAENKDYDNVKSLYLEAAKHFKGKVRQCVWIPLLSVN